MRIALLLCLLALCCATWAAGLPQSAAATFAVNGAAKMPVVTGATPDPLTVTAARELAEYLSKISGGKFEVATGDGATGIAVGTPADFPTLGPVAGLVTDDPLRREDYLLRTHAQGVLLLGATPQAVRDAVWDLLYRLGYRQFFESPEWEVIPNSPTLQLTADSLEHPDYAVRRIWYGFGTWDENKAMYTAWCVRNRSAEAFSLNTGHSYDGYIAHNKKLFEAHPEYYGLVKGERKSSKICISNPAARQVVIDDAMKQFAAKASQDSVSTDPSDGGNWCECAECAKLGSISDRAVTLANAVADAAKEKFGNRYVGMYAYNQHSPPPNIQVHDNVIINVATAFISGGFTVDQLIDGWQAHGVKLFGIREYYSVNTWDRDLPGASRGSNSSYLVNTITHFNEKGARFLSAESGDCWGPNGLGYYLASRMLWDVDEAKRVDELKEDFLTRAFGPAKEPMRVYYELTDGKNKPLVCADLLGRMYRQLDAARKATNDPAVLARINDLVLYTRYVELYHQYDGARGEARQAAFEQLIRHAYRIHKTGMVHSYGLYRDLANRDKSVKIPDEAKFNVAEGKNPWKSTAPFSEADLAKFIADGIANNTLVDFTPVQFGSELVKPAGLKLAETPNAMPTVWGSRGTNRLYTWIDKAPAVIRLKVTGGTIYQGRPDVTIRLFPAAEAEGKAVAEAAAPTDEQSRDIELKTNFTGLHVIEISDRMAGMKVEWEAGQPLTLEMSTAQRYDAGQQLFFFYVPKGTKVIGGLSSADGTLIDPDGKTATKWDGGREYFSVPVPAGTDGKLWSFKAMLDKRELALQTVPPYIARSAQELLLPKEVVEKDGK